MTPENIAERPKTLPTTTQRIDTGWGRIYVEVSEHEGEPFDVFVTTGASGDLYNSQAEALGMLCSAAIRMADDRGEAAEVVANALVGIRSPQVAEDNGDRIHSIPDAVGVALRRHVRGEICEPVKDEGEADGEPEVLP